MKKIFLFLIIIITNISTYSQTDILEEPIQEFFLSNAVYAQDKGEIQITASNGFYNFKTYKTFTPAIEVEYGITNKFQVGVGTEYNVFKSSSSTIHGIGKSEIGLLYNISKKKKFSMSVMLETQFPTANENVTERSFEVEPAFVIAHQFGKSQIHWGASMGFGEETEVNYNVAFLYPFTKIVLTGELNGYYEDETFMFFTPGLTWKPVEIFEVGIGCPIKIMGEEPNYGIIFGVTFEFGDND